MIDYPKTPEEAKKARYGAWAGFPSGHSYDDKLCAYEVWEQGRGATAFQCRRKNGYGVHGLYCKQHAQKLGMIEAPAPKKPRRVSFVQRLIDENKALRAEVERLRAELGKPE